MKYSNTGAELLRTHSVWLLDGTFASTPAPFGQINIVMARSEHGDRDWLVVVGLLSYQTKNHPHMICCSTRFLRKSALTMHYPLLFAILS